MKKNIVLALCCVVVFAVAFTPAQAQQIALLDFNGVGTCSGWINSTFAGVLAASPSGTEDIVTSSNAGGAAPECSFFPGSGFYITVVGGTANSFSVLSAGVGPIYLSLDNTVTGANVFNGFISTGIPFSFSGADFDSITMLDSGMGVWIDNLVLNLNVPVIVPGGAPRINGSDWGAPVALFCAPDGGIDIYNIVGDQGVFFRRISDQAIADAISVASSSGNSIPLLNAENTSVWIFSTGEVQVNRGSYSYQLRYESNCGALPEPAFFESEDEEDSGVIINRPR